MNKTYDGYYKVYRDESGEHPIEWASRGVPYREEQKPSIVSVIPIHKDGRLVVIRQYRPTIGEYIYELPAGKIDAGETPVQAGIRELFEETGLSVLSTLSTRQYLFPSAGIIDECHVVMTMFVDGKPSNAHNEDSEDIEVILMSRDELYELMVTNADAMTLHLQHFVTALLYGDQIK